ncbi:MAG: hypothetical protein AB7F86_13125 [Bdellovibrionales bacterium]
MRFHFKYRRSTLTVLIVLHFLCILAANVPLSQYQRKVSATFAPYLNSVGVWQKWNLFAPNPPLSNVDIRAVYSIDGVTLPLPYLSTQELDPWQKQIQHRLIKHKVSLTFQRRPKVWEDFCRFLMARDRMTQRAQHLTVKITHYQNNSELKMRRQVLHPCQIKP